MNDCLPSRLWLIRHGQTAWNEAGRCLGRTDLPLSENGKEAVIVLSQTNVFSKCDKVYCSPALRAIETAILLKNGRRQQIEICEELQEIDFGRWEGLTWQDIIQSHFQEWVVWQKDPLNSAPYGGETLREVLTRIMKFLLNLNQNKNYQTVLLIGHGGSFNVLLSYLFGINLDVIWTFKLKPASLSEVLVYPNRSFLTLFNYTNGIKNNCLEVLDEIPI